MDPQSDGEMRRLAGGIFYEKCGARSNRSLPPFRPAPGRFWIPSSPALAPHSSYTRDLRVFTLPCTTVAIPVSLLSARSEIDR
jgi:hypothetical protein